MASLVSYGACQSACNVGWVACYAAAGFTAGTVTAGAAAPAAALACNTIQGSCMAACAAKFLAEGSAETAATGGVMGPVVAIGGLAIGVATYLGPGAAGAAGATAATSAGTAGAAVATRTLSPWLVGTGALGVTLVVALTAYQITRWWQSPGDGGGTANSAHCVLPIDQAVWIHNLQPNSRLNGKVGKLHKLQPATKFTSTIGRTPGGMLLQEVMTIEEAKIRAPALPGCQSFYFIGEESDKPTMVYFIGNSSHHDGTLADEGHITSYSMTAQTAVYRIQEGGEFLANDQCLGCVRAWYGVCGTGNEWIVAPHKGKMVTDIVQVLSKLERFKVVNDVLGGDPAPLREKVLVVEVVAACWSVELAHADGVIHVHLPLCNIAPVPDPICLQGLSENCGLNGQVGQLQAWWHAVPAFEPDYSIVRDKVVPHRQIQPTKELRVEEHQALEEIIEACSIIRAWYGPLGHEWTARGKDVTSIVRGVLRQGKLVCATNRDFGDPAPLRSKVLVIETTVGGWVVKMQDTQQTRCIPSESIAPLPAFPKGIRVKRSPSQDCGTVIGIDKGLIKVDFNDGREPQLCNHKDLTVGENIANRMI